MKAEQARKLTEQTLETLTRELEQGTSLGVQRYLAVMARFHRYSFGNILLILSQRPEATRVAGFHTWRKLGRFVRAGEKGIAIFAPMRVAPREDAPEGEADKAPSLRFKVVHVFDVAQTEGEPLPSIEHETAGDPAGALDNLRRFVLSRGLTVEYSDDLGGAEGATNGKWIRLRTGQTPAGEFATLAHELAHTMLHFGEERPASRTVRETEAEAVAFVVCQAVGLDATAASRDYIQLYQGDAETLANSLDRIQKVAAAIIEAVTDQVDQEPLIAA
jgi:antirestriction protein ArdC